MPLYQDDYNSDNPNTGQRKPLVSMEQVNEAFKKYLGHGREGATDNPWENDASYEQNIAGSDEAKAWAARNTAAPAAPAAPQAQTYSPAEIAAHALRGMNIGPGGYNQEALSQAFQQKQFSGNANIDLASFLASLGPSGIASGVTQISPDKIRLPSGEVVDVIQNVGANGQGGAWWSAGGGGGGSAASSGGGGGATSVAGGPAAAASNPAYNAQRDALFKTLLDRSKQSLNIDPTTDQNIRTQADPFAAAYERSSRNSLADLAERAGPLANLQGEARMSAEKGAQAKAGYEASLVGKELASRRDEIQQALTQMGGMLSQDQTVALQRELTQINDALQRAQLAQQGSLATQQMGQQNDQFLANLGLTAADKASYWDAVRSGLI